ncbi:MAG: ribosomal RNA small subunit methyltransferase A [Spiroplasma sp.]|nr:ribosomal RNA small subunit methyltransferase A [Mycoplasmatales bacterium]
MCQSDIKTNKNHKLKLKKSLGQNFLTDKTIIEKIITTADIDEQTSIIEIGPGVGALTEILLKTSENVVAIEIDQRLIPILKEKFSSKYLTIINEDFLKISPKELKKHLKNNKIKVVANLPYYITTPIITKILLTMPYVDEVLIMVQKEVAERITASAKTKKYNSLSVFCQTISDVKYEFTVSKEVFKPVPKVDSAIISFKRKEFPIEIDEFDPFVRNCFKQKRKTLLNNLTVNYPYSKLDILEFLKVSGYKENIRSEEIEVEDFLELFKKFNIYFCRENQPPVV